MKLTYPQLENHLKKSLDSLYLISGDELLLKNEAIHLLRKTSGTAGFHERIRLTPEIGFDEEKLYSFFYSSSLLMEKRLLELDFRDATPNKIVTNMLTEYITHPSTQNILLILMNKIDYKITKTEWYQTLEKTGIVVTIWPISREQLPQWIMQRAKKYKLSFQPEAVQLLADYVEGNLLAAAQAIEKLYLLTMRIENLDQKKSTSFFIEAKMVHSVLTHASQFTIFDFIDSFIAGQISRTLHILDHLKIAGTEPALILWYLTREIRMMATLANEVKKGEMPEKIFQKHRIFYRRQAAIRRFLNRFRAEDCWEALLKAAEIDGLIKGVATNNVWQSLQLFCLRMV
jgi:DNA polymerase-3 subunit delta